MKDIVERLRAWVHTVKAVPASDIMDEAADEIERLRLTDAEREAIREGADALYGDSRDADAATLRALLERLGK
jgi:hypothetical protein